MTWPSGAASREATGATSAHRARSGHTAAIDRDHRLTTNLPVTSRRRPELARMPAITVVRAQPRGAGRADHSWLRALDAGALEYNADVLRLRLARAGVDLAHDVDRRGGDRRGHAALAALRHDVAVHVIDLGRAPLGHVLPHRRAPVASAGGGRREHTVQGVVDLAAVGSGPLLGGGAAEFRHAMPERQPDPRGLG